jgi:hypothetical protein
MRQLKEEPTIAAQTPPVKRVEPKYWLSIEEGEFETLGLLTSPSWEESPHVFSRVLDSSRAQGIHIPLFDLHFLGPCGALIRVAV